jgi:hypothetical protein
MAVKADNKAICQGYNNSNQRDENERSEIFISDCIALIIILT